MSVSIDPDLYVSHRVQNFLRRRVVDIIGLSLMVIGLFLFLSIASWSVSDPSYNTSSSNEAINFLGVTGAIIADLSMQLMGLSSAIMPMALISYGWLTLRKVPTGFTLKRSCFLSITICAVAFGLSIITTSSNWPLHVGLGGLLGDALSYPIKALFGSPVPIFAQILSGIFAAGLVLFVGPKVFGISFWGAILPDSVYGNQQPSADLHGMDITELMTPEPIDHEVDHKLSNIAQGYKTDEHISPFTYIRGASAHYLRNIPALIKGRKKHKPVFADADFHLEEEHRIEPVIGQESHNNHHLRMRDIIAEEPNIDHLQKLDDEEEHLSHPDIPMQRPSIIQTFNQHNDLNHFEEVQAQEEDETDICMSEMQHAGAQGRARIIPMAVPNPQEPEMMHPQEVEADNIEPTDHAMMPQEDYDINQPAYAAQQPTMPPQQPAMPYPHMAYPAYPNAPMHPAMPMGYPMPSAGGYYPNPHDPYGQMPQAPMPHAGMPHAGMPPQAQMQPNPLHPTPQMPHPHQTQQSVQAPMPEQPMQQPVEQAEEPFDHEQMPSEDIHHSSHVPQMAQNQVEPEVAHQGTQSNVAIGSQMVRLEPAPQVNNKQYNIAYEFPSLDLLQDGSIDESQMLSEGELHQSASLLEETLSDFGIRGEIMQVRPGPVVTLYELEPAPGTKSSRVIGLSDDIARSMCAVSARVAVVPGRNVIGIELPNEHRQTVYLRESLASKSFQSTNAKLPLCLGKTIGGEPVITDLSRMPHLLIAGTTGSGKSVAVNTMIMSLLYRLTPQQCKLIMIDPKMLELSIYDGIPHLLTPVVTDPKKAVVAMKWAVREMEERYKNMSKLGVRNIDGYNRRVAEAAKKGETITRTVQTGFNRETGQAIYEQENLQLEPIPYIVMIVDEMADLMMVAGKEIEGAIQRLAQMARAAGIHLIMATQRPSVDVITGTIKANFPTRISFQVTSKIDSRTILGEQGAENLLGQGDMLYMAGGGRISRVHGPFVADAEVEDIVAHLKSQGVPEYLETITEEDEAAATEAQPGEVKSSGDEIYDKAVAIVLKDRKASTSYVQRRLQIGYNRAATLIERMENEGVISPPNNSGKREILVGQSQ